MDRCALSRTVDQRQLAVGGGHIGLDRLRAPGADRRVHQQQHPPLRIECWQRIAHGCRCSRCRHQRLYNGASTSTPVFAFPGDDGDGPPIAINSHQQSSTVINSHQQSPTVINGRLSGGNIERTSAHQCTRVRACVRAQVRRCVRGRGYFFYLGGGL